MKPYSIVHSDVPAKWKGTLADDDKSQTIQNRRRFAPRIQFVGLADLRDRVHGFQPDLVQIKREDRGAGRDGQQRLA